MKFVYVVTEGENYEGSNIIGIFSNEKNADECFTKEMNKMKERARTNNRCELSESEDGKTFSYGCNNLGLEKWKLDEYLENT